MKHSFKFLLFFTFVLIAGCSKEKTPETAPVPTPESPILKKEIQTLHKAEDLKQSASEDIAEQHKQIEAATQ